MKFPSLALPRLLGMLALGVSLMGFAGCVSQDEHKRLQTAFDQARAQLAESENENKNLRAKVAELEAKIAELNRLLDANGGLSALKRERDLLAQQLAELQAKYNDLLKLVDKTALPTEINSALKDLVAQYPDLMEFDERTGMIRLKSDVTFALGSTEVSPRAKELLKKLAMVMNNEKIAKNEIDVVGHTDDVPIRKTATNVMNPTNWALSTNRAWSVLAVLHEAGLSEARGEGSGWGEQRPIAPNAAGKKGNEKNRRIEIFIKPTTVPDGIIISTPGAATPAPKTPAPKKTGPAPKGPATTEPTVPIPM